MDLPGPSTKTSSTVYPLTAKNSTTSVPVTTPTIIQPELGQVKFEDERGVDPRPIKVEDNDGLEKLDSTRQSIINITKSCLGLSAASIHQSYMQCGLWTALILNVCMGAAVGLSMYELAIAAEKIHSIMKLHSMSYPDLAEAALSFGHWKSLRDYGRCFRHVVETMLCINHFGACSAYQIMMARTLNQLIEESPEYDKCCIRIYIACLFLPCVVVSLLTNMKHLAPFAVAADLSIFLIAAATVHHGSKAATIAPQEMPIFNSIPGVFEMMGVCLFTMEGMGVVKVVEHNVKTPQKFPLVMLAGISLGTLLVMIIGFFGAWGYGNLCQSPVTLNFPIYSFAVNLKIFLLLMLYVTFGLTFYIAFNVLWSYISMWHSYAKLQVWERVYRVLCVGAITGLAVVLPDVSKLFAVLGCVCVSWIGFIFPAFISLLLYWEKRNFLLYCRVSILFLFGLGLGGPGIVFNVWALIDEVYLR